MRPPAVLTTPDAAAVDLVARLSKTKGNVGVVITFVPGGRCVGVISASDVEDREVPYDATVADIASAPPVTCVEDNTLAYAAALMLENRVHNLPVLDAAHGQVVGVLSRDDVIADLKLADEEPDENDVEKHKQWHHLAEDGSWHPGFCDE